jgi:hypothetical protein
MKPVYKTEATSKNGATYVDRRLDQSFITRVKIKIFDKLTDSIATLILAGCSAAVLFAYNGYISQQEFKKQTIQFQEKMVTYMEKQDARDKLLIEILKEKSKSKNIDAKIAYLEGFANYPKSPN